MLVKGETSLKKAFTLLELLIVVIVISVLATFAMPAYLRSVERAKEAKARHNMALIASAENLYRAENDTYVNAGDNPNDAGAPGPTLGDYVELEDIGQDDDWTYSVTNASSDTFLIHALRTAGYNSGEELTLNHDKVWGGDFTPY